jgi:hypothetical protein
MLLFYAALRNSRRIITNIYESCDDINVNELHDKNDTLNSIYDFNAFLTNRQYTLSSGYDMRNMSNNISTNINQMITIRKNFEKNKLVNKLMNPNIIPLQKLKIIEDNDHLLDNISLVPNITSGGLFDDFNFEI